MCGHLGGVCADRDSVRDVCGHGTHDARDVLQDSVAPGPLPRLHAVLDIIPGQLPLYILCYCHV